MLCKSTAARCGLIGLVALTVSVARPADAQLRVARFQVTAVGDTTLDFSAREATWVRRGRQGTAVDPRKRDELVARFTVLYVRNGVATALVTGQTTAVSIEHVALIPEPNRRWFKQRAFWTGVFLGAAIGTGTALATR